MEFNSPYVIIAGTIVLVAGLIYLFRDRLTYFALNRGIYLIQKFILRFVYSISNSEPSWVVVKYPGPKTCSLGFLTQKGDKYSTIFIPSGPKLIPGQLIFIENQNFKYLGIDFSQGLTLFISLGLITDTTLTSREIWKRMEEF